MVACYGAGSAQLQYSCSSSSGSSDILLEYLHCAIIIKCTEQHTALVVNSVLYSSSDILCVQSVTKSVDMDQCVAWGGGGQFWAAPLKCGEAKRTNVICNSRTGSC
jgi:hypothetical protein